MSVINEKVFNITTKPLSPNLSIKKKLTKVPDVLRYKQEDEN